MGEHNKVYDGIELVHRYNVFKKSMDAVLEHNSGDHSWTVGINKFSDLTAEEFESTLLGYIGGAKRNSSVSSSEDFACKGRVQLDHGVLLVASYPNYWVIKNSWGSSWGLNGFIQLSKASGSNCGVDQSASYPSGATA